MIGGAFIPVTGKARETTKGTEKYRAALRVREKTGSNKMFRRVLQNQGAKIATKDLRFTAPWDVSEGEVSAQKLDQADCNLEMTMIIYKDYPEKPWIDLNWEHTVSYTLSDNDAGEPPYDIIGLSFEQRDYDLVSGSWYGGNSTEKRNYNNYGVSFNYCDACCREYEDATGDCTPEGETFTIRDSCGMRVVTDETSDPSLRTVYADYWHTYKDITIESVTISSSGHVSVTVSDETKKWLKETDISEDEAEYRNNNGGIQ